VTRVRHTLTVLLALAALVSTLGWSNPSLAACPMDMPMAMAGHHHHGSPKPATTEIGSNCAACIAVLPMLAPLGTATPPPFLPFAFQLNSLSGIDPALDPPPPRGA